MLWAMGFPALLLLALASLLNSAGEPDYIPLHKGNYWVDQASVQWIEKNPQTAKDEMLARTLTWRAEIVDVLNISPGCTVALVHGWPGDLDWYTSQTQPSDRLLVRIGTDYYQIARDARELFDQLKQANGNVGAMSQQLDGAQLFLPTPLTLRKTFGGSPASQVTRQNCQVVENANAFDLSSVKGAPSIDNPTDYIVTYRSTSEIAQMDVVPGLGIVHHGYHHKGAKMEVDAKLIEFGPPPELASPSVKKEEPTIP